MKMRDAHIVPLSQQAASLLKELQHITGRSRYVFPSPISNQRPMSNNAILCAMRRMGISKEEMISHGFRAMARTVLDEVLHVRPDYIEHQLAHAVRDPNGRACNRTAHLPERRKMMQDGADYLDGLREKKNQRKATGGWALERFIILLINLVYFRIPKKCTLKTMPRPP